MGPGFIIPLTSHNFIRWRGLMDQGTSPCQRQISSKYVNRLQRYCDFSNFQNGCRHHFLILEIWKRRAVHVIYGRTSACIDPEVNASKMKVTCCRRGYACRRDCSGFWVLLIGSYTRCFCNIAFFASYWSYGHRLKPTESYLRETAARDATLTHNTEMALWQ